MARSSSGAGTSRRVGTTGGSSSTGPGVEASHPSHSAPADFQSTRSGPSGTHASRATDAMEQPGRRNLRPRPGAKTVEPVAAQAVHPPPRAAHHQRKARRGSAKEGEAMGEAHPAVQDVVVLSDDEEETGEPGMRGDAAEAENAEEGLQARQRQEQQQKQQRRGNKRQRGALVEMTNISQAPEAETVPEDVAGWVDSTSKPLKAPKNNDSSSVAARRRDTPRDGPQPSSFAGAVPGDLHTGSAETRNARGTEAKEPEGQATATRPCTASGQQQLPGSAHGSCVTDPPHAKAQWALGSVGDAGRRDSRGSKRGAGEGVAAALGFGDAGAVHVASNASSRKAREGPEVPSAGGGPDDSGMEGAEGAGIMTTLKPSAPPAHSGPEAVAMGTDGEGLLGARGTGMDLSLGLGRGARTGDEWEGGEEEEVEGEGEAVDEWEEGGEEEGEREEGGEDEEEHDHMDTRTRAESQGITAARTTATAATTAPPSADPQSASASVAATATSRAASRAASGASRRHSTGTVIPSPASEAPHTAVAPASDTQALRSRSLRRLRSSDPAVHRRQQSGGQGARSGQGGQRHPGAAHNQVPAGHRGQRQASAPVPVPTAAGAQRHSRVPGAASAASGPHTGTPIPVCTATGRAISNTRDAPDAGRGNAGGGAGGGGGSTEEPEGAGSRGKGLRRGPLQLGVISIDSFSSDPQACTTYAVDIYKHLRLAELRRRPSPSCLNDQQQEITPAMRAILVDWLVEVAEQYRLVPDTLYLTINYIDRYLSIQPVTRARLQLLGVSCMLIASKYEEIYAPQVDEFCYITDNTYRREEVLEMEHIVLNTLHFQLSVPTVKTFLRRFNRAAQADLSAPSLQLEFLGNFLAELTLVDYASLRFIPSLIAASAVAVARVTLWPEKKAWTQTLEYYSGYTAQQLQECASHILSLQRSGSNQLPAIREKYRQIQFQAVAALQPVMGAELTAKLNVASAQ